MGFCLERSVRSLVHLGLALLVCVAASATPVGAQPSAPVELLGVPRQLNDNGEIAGWVFVGPSAHAAIYRDGAWQDLGVPAGDQLSALFGINSQGAVVGFSFAALPGSPNTDNRWSAIWAPEGATSVELLSGLTPDSFAYGINDNGEIVGCRNRYDDAYPDSHRAFLYHADGSVTNLHDLLSPPGTQTEFDYTCARDINSAGDVAGEVQPQNAAQRGFLFRSGMVQQLVDGASYLLNAKAISDSGKIVGEGRMSGFISDHALVYDRDTETISSLGLESTGAFRSQPNDINSRGDVVGTMSFLVGTAIAERAFLALGGQVLDLNDVIPCGTDWVLQEAISINAQGQIVGRGYRTPSTATSYFLLTPTNSPPAVSLPGSYTVNEGGALELAAVSGDDNPCTLAHAWSVAAGSGVIEAASGPTATFSAADGDGTPAGTTVRITVTDAWGLVATAEAAVTIDNVAPTATFSAAPASVYAGEIVTLSFADATDPSTADIAAGFSYAFSCADAEWIDAVPPLTSHQCIYADAGGKTAGGRITDKDGGTSGFTATMTVLLPQEGAGGLIQIIQTLQSDGVLGSGNANALIVKLEGAIQQLDNGNVGQAVNKLEAFINQVEAFIQSGTLTPVTGQALIDEANRIIAALTG